MDTLVVSKQRLRELEITAEMGANLVKAMQMADGDVFKMLDGMQEALAQYMARRAVEDAMGGAK